MASGCLRRRGSQSAGATRLLSQQADRFSCSYGASESACHDTAPSQPGCRYSLEHSSIRRSLAGRLCERPIISAHTCRSWAAYTVRRDLDGWPPGSLRAILNLNSSKGSDHGKPLRARGTEHHGRQQGQDLLWSVIRLEAGRCRDGPRFHLYDDRSRRRRRGRNHAADDTRSPFGLAGLRFGR